MRFVCVVSGGPGTQQWDAHRAIDGNHTRKAAETDRPVAGLLKDLKRRGLLDSTLVLWGGEFGRSPEGESSRGRGPSQPGLHDVDVPAAALKGGQLVGRSTGMPSASTPSRGPYHFRDVHNTILHLLGLDQHRLDLIPILGRNERLTFVEGKVIQQIV